MTTEPTVLRAVTRGLIGSTRTTLETAPADWLLARAGDDESERIWLLAHTTEGVIWGIVEGGALTLSSDQAAFKQPPTLALTWETLLQMRLFGPAFELLVWRGPALAADGSPLGEQWQWRRYEDDGPTGELVEYLVEDYLLWGTRELAGAGGFMQSAEGAQGIVHAPPIAARPDDEHRARLEVRHYLTPDPTSGMLHIDDSRLVRLKEPQR